MKTTAIEKFKVDSKLSKYNKEEAEKLVGQVIKKHDDEYLIKCIIEHHFIVIRDDGFFDTWGIKEYFDDLEADKKRNSKFDEIAKLFDNFCFRDKKWSSSEGTEYIVGMSKNDSFMGIMFDHRTVSFDYYGDFGIRTKGWSNVDIERLVDSKEFLKIPKEKIREQALEDFKKDFKEKTDLKSEIMFLEYPLKDDEEINIVFWNPKGKTAFKITGPYSDSDKLTGTGGWGKTWYSMNSGEIKVHPTKTTSGSTGGRNKFSLPKAASLVSSDVVYEKVFSIMKERIDFLFKQTTKEKEEEF